jgi:hypothetical protein
VMNLEALPDPAAQHAEPKAQKRPRRTAATSSKPLNSRTSSRRAGARS